MSEHYGLPTYIGDAFFSAVDDVSAEPVQPLEPIDRFDYLRSRSLSTLSDYFKEYADLPLVTVTTHGGTHTVRPQDYAHGYMEAAFEDAQVIATAAVDTIDRDTSLTAVSRADILRRSKSSLLIIANMRQMVQEVVTTSLRDPNPTTIRSFLDDEAANDGLMKLSPTRQGNNRVVWRDSVVAYVAKVHEPGRACPAVGALVTRHGRRGSILNLFWDDLVTYVYPDVP